MVDRKESDCVEGSGSWVYEGLIVGYIIDLGICEGSDM